MSKLTVWNISATVQSTPSYVSLYGQTIPPGKSRRIDSKWVDNYPAPLRMMTSQGLIHVGSTLPPNYRKAVEEQMKKVKNILDKPITLQGKKFSPTLIKPQEEMNLPDAAYEDVKCDGLVVVGESQEAEEPVPSEEPVETPKEEPPADPPKPKIEKKVIKKRVTKKKKTS